MNIANAQQISGWMTDKELEYLAEITSKCRIIIEAGSFQGRSTRVMADNSDALIICVDPWKPQPIAAQAVVDNMTYTRFAWNLDEYIKSGRVLPIAKKFTDYYPLLNPDFIFIDALHDYTNVKKDIEHALGIIRENTKPCILAGHDYSPTWPGVLQAVGEIFGENRVTVVDTIWRIDL